MQKEQFFQYAMKDTWVAANRMAATDRVRYKTSQYHDHRVVLGVFDRLLVELVFSVCLLVPDPVSLASQPLSLDCATPREEKGLV